MIGPQLFQQQRPDVDPHLFVANHIVQLTALEVEQLVIQELDENPALELAERTICSVCKRVFQAGYCYQCSAGKIGGAKEVFHADELSFKAGRSSDDANDPLTLAPAPLTLSEHLFMQLQCLLDKQDHEIAFHLVENLDEHGYLTLSIEELAQHLLVEDSRVSLILKELQQLEPVGIGARDLIECLLLQVERLCVQGVVPPPSICTIIRYHLEQLSHHQFERIRALLNISREEVEEVFLFIRTNLHPYPAYHYYSYCPDSHVLPAVYPPPVPSVFIYQSTTSPCGYEIEVVESHHLLLRINPLYRRIRRNADLAHVPGELEHVSQYLERARLFISQLRRRYLLLEKVVTYLVNYQRDFLDYGPSHLYPLTQKMVAQAVNVHASTISRVIANKFAVLPSRELIPLSRFFSAELRVQDFIRQEIIVEKVALSDESLAKILKQKHGITLSRQMVANYRIELGIPAARQRAVLRRCGGKSYEI